MAKITDVFSLWKSTEENIRECLGCTSGINKAIIDTLKDSKERGERGKFFYYNNGITIICDEAKGDSNGEFYC